MKKMSSSSPWKSHFSSSSAVPGNTSSSTTSLHPETAAHGRTYINLRRGSAPNCQETVSSKHGSGTSKSGGFLSVTSHKIRKTSQPDLRCSQGITLSFLGLVAGSKYKQQQSSAKTSAASSPQVGVVYFFNFFFLTWKVLEDSMTNPTSTLPLDICLFYNATQQNQLQEPKVAQYIPQKPLFPNSSFL